MTPTTFTHYVIIDADGRQAECAYAPEFALLRAADLNAAPSRYPRHRPPFRAVKITTTSTIEELTP